jgi:hypothetical protein
MIFVIIFKIKEIAVPKNIRDVIPDFLLVVTVAVYKNLLEVVILDELLDPLD